MNKGLAMSAGEYALVREIVRRHLSPEFKVFVFGSRAGGLVKRFSDLDLSIEGPEPVGPATLDSLRDDFDESDLIWKVDLVDRTTVSEAFGKLIDAKKLPLD